MASKSFDFEFVLSHKSITNLVKNLKAYQTEFENSKIYILEALAKYTHERVRYYISETVGKTSYVPTGQLLESIKISEIINDVAKVYTNLAYAKFVEFGTGVTGSENSHPKSSEFGWSYDVNEHGEKGWFYKASDGNVYWTEGQVAHQFMYRAFEDLKENYIRIARAVLRERGLIR